MAFIPAVNCARVSLQSNYGGEMLINTLWFKHRVGAITVPALEDLAAGMNTWYIDNMLPLMSSAVNFLGSIAYDYTTEFAPAVNVAVTGAFGSDGANPLPYNVAFCVKFLTTNRGRSSRGRNYVGGLTDNIRIGDNNIQASVADDFKAAYNAILGLALDADWEWSVVSFRTAGAPRAAGFAQPVVGANYSDTVFDSQRRRLPGRGD